MLNHNNQRRHLLKLMAAAALSACAPLPSLSKPQRVVVCGAGIVGASIAYHLAKSGAAVTVIDKEAPASHASRATFAWINATWAKQPQHYHSLNQQSVSHWHSLQKELGLPIRWQGSVEWFSSEQRQQKLEHQEPLRREYSAHLDDAFVPPLLHKWPGHQNAPLLHHDRQHVPF